MKNRLAVIVFFQALLALIGAPSMAWAEGCVRVKEGRRSGGIIALEVEPAVPAATVEEAIAFWSRCKTYGSGFPSFTPGVSGTRVVEVKFVDGSSGSAKCGVFHGATVVLYSLAISSGRLRHCGPPSWLLAHELGHVLGLADCPESDACRRAMMSQIDPRTRQRPTVTEAECEAVDRQWEMPREVRQQVRGSECERAPGPQTPA